MEFHFKREKIDQFKKDVAALGQYHIRIAEKMGLNKSNFSSYYHEKHPITENFLKKFYAAWGEELKAVDKKRRAVYPTDPTEETLAMEKVTFYPETKYRDDYIHTLRKNNDALLNNLDKVIESNLRLVGNNEKLVSNNEKLINNNEKLVENNLKLIGSNEKLVENNLKMMDAHLSFLGQLGRKTG